MNTKTLHDNLIDLMDQHKTELGISLKQIFTDSEDPKVCEFHARLAAASVLYCHQRQAEVLQISPVIIRERIARYYRKN